MELFDLLVNLSIALITIDLGIYAIANSMLLGQLKKNALFAERRLSETREEIRRATDEDVSQNVLNLIQERIEEYQEEKQEYDTRITCLKLKGAVIYPCLGFGFTLFIYTIKEYLTSLLHLTLLGIQILMVIGLLFGLYRMFLTLQTIEYASTNIPLPDFDVTFSNGASKMTCYLGGETSMELLIHNRGYSLGEFIEVTAFFPKGSVVSESESYVITPQGESETYPETVGVCLEFNIIHVDVTQSCVIDFIPPIQIGTYDLPVWINEKNITQKEFMLKLEVLQRPS